MEVSGVLSSWLTMPRNSARSRSSSSIGVMSCMVTTTDSTSPSSPSSEKMGVALTRVVTLSPVGGLEDDLLGPHRLSRAQPLGQGELHQGDLPAVGPPEGQHLQ